MPNPILIKRRRREPGPLETPVINAFVDSLLKQVSDPEDTTGRGGLLQQLQVKLLNRALGAELTAHFGHEPGEIPSTRPLCVGLSYPSGTL